jgi:acyl-CoA dehydrogenase
VSAVSSDQAFLTAVRRVASDVAAAHADDVDRNARFPHEAIDALRAVNALGAYIPERLGGLGVSFDALADACYHLGRSCSATGMVFAMHQIQVGAIADHADSGGYFEQYQRRLARDQRLIASATSEVGPGGDLRRSNTAVERLDGDRCQFEKHCTTISYGEHADDLLTTTRRSVDADHGDQVLVLTSLADTELERTNVWDTLGMRGTCSPGFVVRAQFDAEQILPVAFAVIAPETMVPWTHLLWAHLWLGIATDAFERARRFVQGLARRNPGSTPPPATRLARLASDVARLRSYLDAATGEYTTLAYGDRREELASITYAVRINNVKINASESCAEICQAALGICGILGYKNDTPFSVGRHLRDALSAAVMIANERIVATNAQLVLVQKEQ